MKRHQQFVMIDAGIYDHPKIMEAGPEAGWLYVCGVCYVGRHDLDGRIPAACIPYLMVGGKKHARRLVEVGLWDRDGDGYRIRGYARRRCRLRENGHQAARDEWATMRRVIAPVIFQRDGHACRYCGQGRNLTVDHVLPLSRGGDNAQDNLVTACRSCNSSKHDKTPEEWQR